MTPERARQLVAEHGCRLKVGNPSSLVIINEAINFQYALPLDVLNSIDEEAFIATITMGHTRRGQPALPGFYRDYHPPRDLKLTLKVEVIIADDLSMIPDRPFSPRGKVTQKLLRPGQETLPNVVILDPFTPDIPPSRALQKENLNEK